MPRPRKLTTVLAKRRLDKRWSTQYVGDQAGISGMTVIRIEAGKPILRTTASSYLQFWGIDLADSSTWPPELDIVDLGEKVRIVSTK